MTLNASAWTYCTVQVLNGLEKNIADFEQMTGREMAEKAEEGEPSLTGFTERLVTAVNKVSKYLKEVGSIR